MGHFTGHGLTLKDKLQCQMSVGYRGHTFIKMLIIKRFSFPLMRKRLNVQNSLMAVEETPVAAILFFKMRQKIFLCKLSL